MLALQDEPRGVRCGETVGHLTALWLPLASPREAATTVLEILDTSADLFAARLGDYLCAGNFGRAPAELAAHLPDTGDGRLVLGGVAARTEGPIQLLPGEPVIVALQEGLSCSSARHIG